MSRSIGKQTLLKTFAKRSYSAQTALRPSVGDYNVDVTTKNIKIITANVNNPSAKISFSFKAGSRFEKPETLGVTHVLRKSIGLSTKEHYPFNITRMAQQNALNLYATTDRETFTVTVEAHPSAIESAFHHACVIATQPVYKPWEIQENRERIKLELSTRTPEVKALDSLHQVAYRNGLGNSLYVHESRLGKISHTECLDFFLEHFTTQRLQITASGVPPQLLNELVTSIELESDKGPEPTKAVYYGGETRTLNATENLAYVAIAGEAPGYTKKEFLPFAILKFVYGTRPITYGCSHGVLSKALANTGVFGAVAGYSASYSDSSLVGFLLIAESGGAPKAVETLVSTLMKADISDKDVARGKALLKTSIAESVEGSNLVDFFSRQISVDTLITPQQLLSAIDSVTAADVKKAAQKIASSKLSASLYGDISAIPYLDTLKK